MARWRDVALVLALLAVGAAAIWGPKPSGAGGALATQSAGASAAAAASPDASPLAAGLALSAADVFTTATPDGTTVLSVRLTARLRSADVVMLRVDSTGPAITFRIAAQRSIAVPGTLRAAPPATIPSGVVTSYELTFDLRGLSVVPPAGIAVAAGGPPAPGPWLLTVDLIDVAGMRHHAETPVMIVPRA